MFEFPKIAYSPLETLSKSKCINERPERQSWFNLHRLISAAIGRWVTSDPAELPFLPGRKKLCTSTVEYNP